MAYDSKKEGVALHIDSIYNQYVDDLYAYGLSLGFVKETCLDAIHDVFYKICLNNKPLAEISHMKSYLFSALRNRLFDIYRTDLKFKRESIDEAFTELPFKSQLTIEDNYILSEEAKASLLKVQMILNSLTDRQREVIYLRYLQEIDYVEISKIMNVSVHSCRKMVYKTLNKLRETQLAMPLLSILHTLFSIQ